MFIKYYNLASTKLQNITPYPLFQLLHIVFHPIFLDKTHSTNDYAIDLLAKSNPIEGTVISTHNQTKGRGQIGRSWFSGSNNNLSCSVILKPTFLQTKDTFYLSMMLGLAVRDTIEHFVSNQSICIKWPNDIYVNDEKIAGLLIQSNMQGKSISSCILGIGLNVNQEIFPSDLPNPISITQITKQKCNLVEVEKALLSNIGKYYTHLCNGDLLLIKTAYLKSLYKRGEMAEFMKPDNSIFTGEIIGVDESGKLVVKEGLKLHKFNLHEIRLLLS